MFHFFVTPDQVGQQEIRIAGRDVNHIKNVLRMKTGEKIQISDGCGRSYLCGITAIERDWITAGILEAGQENTELPARIVLFQGLPKSDKMEFIIQKAVELGACEIVPVATKRTVVKLDGKKEEGKRKRWNAIAESAAKQSGRQVIPKVRPVMTLAEAFSYGKEFDKKLIPYEHAENMEETRKQLGEVKAGMSVGIFIGPEGGFEDSEIEEAMKQGVCPITLGKRILRTETAGLAVLSMVMFLLEE